MANTLSTFSYNSLAVRTEVKDDEVWFVAKDVCSALGFANSRDAISRHVDKNYDVAFHDIIDKLGRKQEVMLINESGLYCLIFGSKKPEALKFKHWVTHEVLPTIRKSGSYSLTNPFDEDPFEIPLNLSYVKQMDMLVKKYQMHPHDVLVLENIRTKSRKQGYGIACSNFEKEFREEIARLGFKTDDLSDNVFNLNARLTNVEKGKSPFNFK